MDFKKNIGFHYYLSIANNFNVLNEFLGLLIHHYSLLPISFHFLFSPEGLKYSSTFTLDYLSVHAPSLVKKVDNNQFYVNINLLKEYFKQINRGGNLEHLSLFEAPINWTIKESEIVDLPVIDRLKLIHEESKKHPTSLVIYKFCYEKKQLTEKEIENFENHIETCDRCNEQTKILKSLIPNF